MFSRIRTRHTSIHPSESYELPASHWSVRAYACLQAAHTRDWRSGYPGLGLLVWLAGIPQTLRQCSVHWQANWFSPFVLVSALCSKYISSLLFVATIAPLRRLSTTDLIFPHLPLHRDLPLSLLPQLLLVSESASRTRRSICTCLLSPGTRRPRSYLKQLGSSDPTHRKSESQPSLARQAIPNTLASLARSNASSSSLFQLFPPDSSPPHPIHDWNNRSPGSPTLQYLGSPSPSPHRYRLDSLPRGSLHFHHYR